MTGAPSHLMTGTSEFTAWMNIKQRCYNHKFPLYSYYGGRGITMCDRWLKSFTNFYDDMGKKPTAEHSIDRINTNGNYEPSNCRWATKTEQARNIRPRANSKSGHNGVVWNKHEERWKAYVCLAGKMISLGTYKELEDAIKARKAGEEKYYV